MKNELFDERKILDRAIINGDKDVIAYILGKTKKKGEAYIQDILKGPYSLKDRFCGGVSEGNTLFHCIAALEGIDDSILEMLSNIRFNPYWSHKNNKGYTALEYICFANNKDVFRMAKRILLSEKNFKYNDIRVVFAMAVLSGDSSMLCRCLLCANYEEIIQASKGPYAIMNEGKVYRNNTLLHCVALQQNFDDSIIKILLGNGVNIYWNVKNSQGYTVLDYFYSSESKNYDRLTVLKEIEDILLSREKFEIYEKEGILDAVFKVAAIAGDTETMEKCLLNKKFREKIDELIKGPHMIKDGDKASRCNTLLHCVASSYKIVEHSSKTLKDEVKKAFKILLDNGGRKYIDVINDQKKIPLDYIKENENMREFVKELENIYQGRDRNDVQSSKFESLINNGSEDFNYEQNKVTRYELIGTKRNYYRTFKNFCTKEPDDVVKDFCQKNDIDPFKPINKSGDTPFYIAVTRGKFGCVKSFFKYKNLSDKERKEKIDKALKGPYNLISKIFEESGGNTLMHCMMAKARVRSKILNLFLESGFDLYLNVRNDQGYAALDYLYSSNLESLDTKMLTIEKILVRKENVERYLTEGNLDHIFMATAVAGDTEMMKKCLLNRKFREKIDEVIKGPHMVKDGCRISKDSTLLHCVASSVGIKSCNVRQVFDILLDNGGMKYRNFLNDQGKSFLDYIKENEREKEFYEDIKSMIIDKEQTVLGRDGISRCNLVLSNDQENSIKNKGIGNSNIKRKSDCDQRDGTDKRRKVSQIPSINTVSLLIE